MTDIAEKDRLGPVQLSQRFGPLSLLFVGARVGQASGDLAGDQLNESGVAGVQRR